MSGAGAAVDPHCASAEMMSVLAALYPGFRLIDGAFPLLPLSWRHSDALALNLGGVSAMEDVFYSGFRQQGGHAPILDAGSLLSYLRAQGAPASATMVFAAPAKGLRALLAVVKPAARVNDVVVAEHSPSAQTDLAAAGFPGGLKLTFRRPSRSQSWVLAGRKGLDAEAFGRVMTVLRQVAVDIGGGASVQGWRDLRVDLPEEGYSPDGASFAPGALLHDGARRSEGDAGYSWIWTGEERRLRMLLGCVPRHFRKLRVIVPNATPASNLLQARLFLNGDLATSQVTTWGDASGAIEAALTPSSAELVVTLAAPEAEAGLSICIDRIELSV